MISKVERLANVVAMLLHAPQPVALVTIVSEAPGYSEKAESARVQFERDKADLRTEGIELETVGSGADARYRIDPATYYLPDLGLDAEEALALNVAASAVRFEGDDPDEALHKVGPPAPTAPRSSPCPPISGCRRSTRRSAPTGSLSFRYGSEREVEP